MFDADSGTRILLTAGRSDPGRRLAELGLENGGNLSNSFPLVTGNSPDVIPLTDISQRYIRGPGRSSKPSVSTPVTRPVTNVFRGPLAPSKGDYLHMRTVGNF
eukprot:COSAG01_NODE_1403_length_10445_cov_67.595399_5_plen_103_part_00